MRLLVRLALPALVAVATACGTDSSTAPTQTPTTQTLTVDASQAFAYVALGDPATTVAVTDPTTSSTWDIGVFATAVTLNGGAAGPGSMSGYCVCQNASATTAQLQAMTPDNQLAAFDAVTTTQIPADGSFKADVLSPVIAGWYSGTAPNVTVTPSLAWIIRKGTSTAILGKFHVTSITGATATTPGTVTFEYALQPSAGAAFGAVVSKTVTVGSTPVYFDLAAGAVGTAAQWDIAFSGYAIRVNGGVSGGGSVMAVPDNATPFANIDAAYASTAPVQAYRTDEFGGVFSSNKWYKYNITGTDNQIWPTFNVYLLKKGTSVYKVQLTGYYGLNGASRQISIRYRKLR
ncbi:MAG: HmuY family protein [Gemmatimonadaceae bacterium]